MEKTFAIVNKVNSLLLPTKKSIVFLPLPFYNSYNMPSEIFFFNAGQIFLTVELFKFSLFPFTINYRFVINKLNFVIDTLIPSEYFILTSPSIICFLVYPLFTRMYFPS